MDIDSFRRLVDDPARSKADLITMRENALRLNAMEHVHVAENALDDRFPTWRTIRTRRGGSKQTHVEFLGKKENFESEKEAYVWLVERFVQYYPKPFVEIDWETAFVIRGPRALYFSKSLKRLFGKNGEHLSADPNKWCHLSNGWFAKLVLSEPQKIALLSKLASVARLQFGRDWDWNSRGRATAAQRPCAEDLLRELEESTTHVHENHPGKS